MIRGKDKDKGSRSLTTISLRSPAFSGSENDACTSQKVPPRSAQILMDRSGTVLVAIVLIDLEGRRVPSACGERGEIKLINQVKPRPGDLSMAAEAKSRRHWR